MKNVTMGRTACALLLGILAGFCAAGVASATNYTLTTTVTTDGVQSLAGGTLSMACRPSGSSWTSCGTSVAAGTEVSIDAVANDNYWFMWFTTNPYLAGCTTTNYGWGCFCANPVSHCGFTMPSSNVNLNAEFQAP